MVDRLFTAWHPIVTNTIAEGLVLMGLYVPHVAYARGGGLGVMSRETAAR